MKAISIFISILGCALAVMARESTDYVMTVEDSSQGGGRSVSADYEVDLTVGSAGGLSIASDTSLRSGYAGQLYDVVSLQLGVDPVSIEEGGSGQLSAHALCDDETLLALTVGEVNWSVACGPIIGIDSAGVATADLVWQDSQASVNGDYNALTGTITLTVMDIYPDNYGSYAYDGITDLWQYFYFGADNPLAAASADPDDDGQNNLFEFTAGLNPTNQLSRFLLEIAQVPGQPDYKELVFSPIVSGRTYDVVSATNLTAATWQTLPGTPPTSDDGDQRTVTDTAATQPVKFYRVRVTAP